MVELTMRYRQKIILFKSLKLVDSDGVISSES